MALAPSKYLHKDDFIFFDNIVVEGIFKNQKVERKVKKTILFKDKTMVLLILEEPVWQLGWCGIIFIHPKENINELPLSMVLNQREGDRK